MIVGNAIKLADVSDPIFGDASLGNVHITADTNLSSMFPDFAEDTGVFELNCKDFTIDSGKTLTADKRNAGVIIRVKGNCTINGTIANNLAPRTLLAEAQAIVEAKYPSWMVENGSGGDGKAGGNSYQNTGGNGQLGRFYGGGASGGGAGGSGYGINPNIWSGYYAGGHGGDATNITTENTAFVGGVGGVHWGSPETGGNGSFGGGAGGGCGCYNTGSGWNNWSGATGASGAGANGTAGARSNSGSGGACGNWGGGVVIIICSGNLIIDGTINCNGNKGGNGDTSNYGTYRASSGGGAGGGRIYLLSKKSISTTGATFSVLGGARGTGGYANGTDGEDGDKYYTTYKNYKDGIAPIPLSA